MNVENIKKVRDYIAALPRARFDMRNWASGQERVAGEILHSCGTAACIAGWTNALLAPKAAPWGVKTAARHLGLASRAAERLFMPQDIDADDWGDITTAHAVAVLDHLMATGSVSWTIAVRPRDVAREGERSEVRTTPNRTDGAQ